MQVPLPKVERGPGSFVAFDGLRAAAALLVIGYHVALASGWTRSGWLAPLGSELKGGVVVFFVISGCLLYLPFARAIRDGQRLPDWRAYAERRLLRILPAYWFALTALAALGLVSAAWTMDWWRYYGLVQIYNGATVLSGLGVAWSLCVEVTFYICLPFIARAVAAFVKHGPVRDRARAQLAIVAVVGLGSLALRAVQAHSVISPVPNSGSLVETALPGMLDWFAIGMALAVIAAAWEADPSRAGLLAWLARRGIGCWLLAAAFFLAGLWTQDGDKFLPLYGLWTHVSLGIASGLLVLPAICSRPSRGPVQVLRTPFAVWLGTVSYGIYLWHAPLIGLLQGDTVLPPAEPAGLLHGLLLLVAAVLGAVCLGAASWYLVERPTQQFARRARRAPPTASARAVA